MAKPRIGITPYFDYEKNEEYMPEGYIRAAELLNGELVTLHYDTPAPSFPSLVRSLDGIILSGGVDVNPRLYGQDPLPGLGRVDPDRDRMEMALLGEALGSDLPILAICRGMQVLNVALGGTLVQDIPTRFPGADHRQKNGRQSLSHDVSLVPGGILCALYGGAEKLRTNSFHHQAVDRPGRGLIPEAWAAEGFPEAYRAGGPQWMLGVQWHPEVSLKADESSRRIFTLFLQAL